jgi:hypothetical protein
MCFDLCTNVLCTYFETDKVWYGLQLYNLLGLFWESSVISGFIELVLAGWFADLYWDTVMLCDAPYNALTSSFFRTAK